MVDNCGHLFNECVDQELLKLIFQALDHTNRFVRETGYYVCSSLVSIGVKDKGRCKVIFRAELLVLYSTLSSAILIMNIIKFL